MAGAQIYLVTGPELPAGVAEDARLCTALLREQPGAAADLWRRYAPLVRRILCRSMGPSADVDDLVQDAFLKFFEKLPTLRNPESLRAFLVSITVFTARQERRSRWIRRCMRLSIDGTLPEPAGHEPDVESREALVRFYRILDRLRARDREIFVLRFMEGLTLPEVAAAGAISLATVKRRVDVAWKRVSALVAADPSLVDFVLPTDSRGTA
jgi:RNA polymerase sigma-70 factor (ECF subfamily)